MTVNFTTTQQKVVFTDTDGAVTFTAATAPVVFTAAVAGPQGPAGAAGSNGQGVPTGGSTGQALVKASATDYDTTWGTVAGSGQHANVALTGSALGAGGAYTVPDDVSFVLVYGTVSSFTLPAVSAATGQRIAIFPFTNALTISTNGSDQFLPPGGTTSADISAGTVYSVVGSSGYWILETRSGSDFDIPFWNGASIPNGRVVQMVSGAPAWSEVTAAEVTYSASTSADWAGSPPSAPATALDTLAARTIGPGYISNQGGTVTQTTSKGTGVTINTRCGTITTHDATLASGDRVAFVVTNSTISHLDTVVLSIQYDGANAGFANHEARVQYVYDGEFAVELWNYRPGDQSIPLTINFAIIAGDN